MLNSPLPGGFWGRKILTILLVASIPFVRKTYKTVVFRCLFSGHRPALNWMYCFQAVHQCLKCNCVAAIVNLFLSPCRYSVVQCIFSYILIKHLRLYKTFYPKRFQQALQAINLQQYCTTKAAFSSANKTVFKIWKSGYFSKVQYIPMVQSSELCLAP